MTGLEAGLAITIVKIATFLGGSLGIITGVKLFNTYEFKGTKKGGTKDGSDEIESLRKTIGSRG